MPPQTSANVAASQGQEYWRLFRTLASSGDIYESEQSARAFVIGPDSDIARVKLIYYDEQNNNLANTVIVSVDKPFIGRLDARNDLEYQSGDQGRILISSADLLVPVGDNPFRPPSSNRTNTAIEIVTPVIDLIQYFNKEPSIIAPRSDKTYLFGNIPNIEDDQQWFLIPFYGRRFAEIVVKTLGVDGGTPAIDVYVYGINFSWIQADVVVVDDNGHQQEMLGLFHLNAPSLDAGVSDSIRVTNRNFDYLGIQIQKPIGSSDYSLESSVVTHITTSDKI